MMTHLNLHCYKYFIQLFSSNVVDKIQVNFAKSLISAFKYSNRTFDSKFVKKTRWMAGRCGATLPNFS